MWPWGHLAFGYLLLVAMDRDAEFRSRTGLLVMALGTQIPDLVDKPLAWWLPVLPAGRSLAHSALLAAVLLPAAAALRRRTGRPELAFPFALGYLSHLAGDVMWPLLTGEYAELKFLLWPITRRPPEELVGLVDHLQAMALSPYSLVQVTLVVAALTVRWHEGTGGTDRDR